MTLHDLLPHPQSGVLSASVAARVELAQGPRLELEFVLAGDLAHLAIPRGALARRAERLWEHTCFEAFVAPAAGARYCEINVAPSTEWAAYAFDSYRHGMRQLELAKPPAMQVAESARELRVTASIELAGLADAPWPWRIGLTAVVEDRTGVRAYYALKHPREKPDFHDAASFTVLLDGSTR